MANYSILVSIALAQEDSTEIEKSIHLLTFEDFLLSKEDAEILMAGIANTICHIAHKESGKLVFGLCVEPPGEGVTVQ